MTSLRPRIHGRDNPGVPSAHGLPAGVGAARPIVVNEVHTLKRPPRHPLPQQ
jgi:hypothetical protein